MISYDYKLIAAIHVANTENYVNSDDPEIMAETAEKNMTEKHVLFKEKITNMTKEAQQIVNIILNAPQELLDFIPINKEYVTLRNLQKYLKNIGWKRDKTLKACKEIKKMLREE